MDTGNGLEAAVFLHFAVEFLIEGLAIGVGPPGFDVALAIVLAALVVEAVGHLVADDDADAAEVDGGIFAEIIEGRLQDTGGEVDVVLRGVVVGVDGGRCHAPLFFVDGLADFVEFVVELEFGRSVEVFDEVDAGDLELRVVAPLVRVADFLAEVVELDLGLFFGLVGHPGQGLDVGGEGFFEGGDELLHVLLGLGGEVFFDPVLADGFAEGAIGDGGAALPASGLFCLTLQSFLEEVEAGILVGLGKPGGDSVNDVEFEVGLEGVEALIGDELVLGLEEVRLADVEVGNFGRVDSGEIGGPVEVGVELIEVGEGHDVVALVRIAEFNAGRRAFGEGGLDIDDFGGFGLRLVF